jgi:hypothetical protein
MQVPLVSLQIGKPVAATPFRKRKNLDIRRTSLLLGVFILLLLLWCLLRYLFPRHRYHHLPEIPQIKTLLEEAPAPVNDHYVVFVSNANGKSPYNIAWAKSSQSAEEALKEALTKMPLQSARYPWFKIDVVTATKVLVNYDFSARHNEVPSWWYGIALDWDHEWVFLPDEVQAHGLVSTVHSRTSQERSTNQSNHSQATFLLSFQRWIGRTDYNGIVSDTLLRSDR